METKYEDIPTVEDALSDPFSALVRCKLAHESDDKREQGRDVAVAAAAYAITHAFERDHAAWGKAVLNINEAGWVKPKIRRDNDLDKIREKVLLVIFRTGDNFNYNKSYKMARALHYCSKKLIKPDKVIGYIERNGRIKGLYTLDTQEYPRQRRKRGADLGPKIDEKSVSDFFADLNIEDDSSPTDDRRLEGLLTELEDVIARLKQIDGRDRVVLEVKPDERQGLCAMPRGKRRTYHVRRGHPGVGPFVSLVGKRVRL